VLAGDGDRRQRLDAAHDLDLIAVGLAQPHAAPAAGLVDRLHLRGAGRLRHAPQIVLARGFVGEADERGIAFLGDVQVMGGVGARM